MGDVATGSDRAVSGAEAKAEDAALSCTRSCARGWGLSVSGKVAAGERKVSLGLRLEVEEELGEVDAWVWCGWRWKRVIAALPVDAEEGVANQGEPGAIVELDETWIILSSV